MRRSILTIFSQDYESKPKFESIFDPEIVPVIEIIFFWLQITDHAQ